MLAEKIFDAPKVTAIAQDARDSPLEPRERAMMAFAEKVALQADPSFHDLDPALRRALTVGRPVASA